MGKRIIKFRVWDGEKMHHKDLGAFVNIENMEITPINCELMQATGMIDKNGKHIYEGDIVEFGTGTIIVKYAETRHTSYGHGDCGEDCSIGFEIGSSYGTNNVGRVIGNIYETPELTPKYDY